ncbi:PIN domain protein [[Synechococcus] sp. NIES-970]|nr:PIN domain protein [[Synechococcus] sp. NIES-970]
MNKLRIALDTNILVSALVFGSSNCREVVTFAKQQGTILTSIAVLTELNQVLSRKKFDRYLTQSIREDFLTSLAFESEIVSVMEKISACRDPKDNKFLELAVNGNADFLVTGDQDLLILNPFQDVEILTAQDFLTWVKDRKT